MSMFEIRHYRTANGHDLIADWLGKLRDVQAKIAIVRRLNRLEQGISETSSHAARVSMSYGSTSVLVIAFITHRLARPSCCC